jgi:hypothetical protein
MSPRPGARWSDPQPCGTPAAYRRHHRHGEKPCRSCRQAEARRQADVRAAHPRSTESRRAERLRAKTRRLQGRKLGLAA